MILLRTMARVLTFRKVIPSKLKKVIFARVSCDWIHSPKYRLNTSTKMTNAPNAIIRYYVKDALIAAPLDLKLRAESAGEVSLDDIMRECWRRWGDGEQGMPEDGLEKVCAELATIDLDDFFNATVRGTGDVPLRAALAAFGIQYNLRPAANSNDKGGKKGSETAATPLWRGAVLDDAAGRLVFKSVLNGGPAEAAGVAPGDIAVALDGVALTTANCDQRLRSYRDGEKLELVVFRGDDLMTMTIKLAEAPQDTCYLTIDADADETMNKLRQDWLQTT